MPYSVFKITGEVIAFSDFPALTLERDGLLDLLSRLSHGKSGSTLAPETGPLYTVDPEKHVNYIYYQ